jgi:hypothetical protein
MTDADWIIVWDFRDAFPWYLIIGPVMLVLACLFFLLIRNNTFIYWPFIPRTVQKRLALSLTAFAGLAAVMVSIVQLQAYLSSRSALANGETEVSEGEAIIRQSVDRTERGILEVAGIQFERSTENGVEIFSVRHPNLGLIVSGTIVRISHIDGRILRIERREQPLTDTPH